MRELVSAMLEAQGYKVLVSQDPSDVGTICEQHKGRIHLLLTDLILPGMSGREIAKRLSRLRPEAAVLFMSGYTDDALIHSHGLDETSAVLQKPFSSVTLGAKRREGLEADGFKVPKVPGR